MISDSDSNYAESDDDITTDITDLQEFVEFIGGKIENLSCGEDSYDESDEEIDIIEIGEDDNKVGGKNKKIIKLGGEIKFDESSSSDDEDDDEVLKILNDDS